MRCRVGDIAVCIHPMNLGVVVRVVERCTDPYAGDWRVELLTSARVKMHAADAVGEIVPPGERVWADDGVLQPLRDEPGHDEVVLRVGRPQDLGAIV